MKKVYILIVIILIIPTCSQKKNETSLLLLGDVLTAKGVEKRVKRFGIHYPFNKVKDRIANYEIVFGNLETSISNKGEALKDKAFTFQMDPKYAAALKEIKLDVVSLANNHLLDFGEESMNDTFRFLKKNNIQYCGAGKTLKEARKPVKIFKNNTNFIFLSYCERPPISYYATSVKAGTAPLDIEMIKKDIKRYKTSENVILISLHWGIERTSIPRKDQIKTAHEIIDVGADGIIGHHPHVPQSIEIYKKKPIIYSLGNFIIGYYNSGYRNNIVTSLHYNKNKLLRLEILPIAGKNSEMEFQPYFLNRTDAEKEIIHIKSISKNFNSDIKFENGKGVIKIN